MTGADVLTAPAADKVREKWHEWAQHARGCETCGRVLAGLLKDPMIDRHSMYQRCCTHGVSLYGDWDVAVSSFVDHLRRSRR